MWPLQIVIFIIVTVNLSTQLQCLNNDGLLEENCHHCVYAKNASNEILGCEKSEAIFCHSECVQMDSYKISNTRIDGDVTMCCCNDNLCNENNPTICKHHLDMTLMKNGVEIQQPNDRSSCLTYNKWCIHLNIEDGARAVSDGRAMAFGKGTADACADGAGFLEVCQQMGNGCENKEKIAIDMTEREIRGNIDVCCCDTGDYCNEGLPVDVKTTTATTMVAGVAELGANGASKGIYGFGLYISFLLLHFSD